MGSSQAPGKAGLRARLLAARHACSAADRAADDAARDAHLLAAPEVRRARTVAAYVAVGAEPGTDGLLAALLEGGVRVLLPVLEPDGDLDWAAYDGPGSLAPASRGLREPTGPRLGRDAVTSADLVLVPGLAVGADGVRLGRGGGSYDRALARLPAAVGVWVLLGDTELLDAVPSEPHDRPVTAAATPGGLRRLPATGG